MFSCEDLANLLRDLGESPNECHAELGRLALLERLVAAVQQMEMWKEFATNRIVGFGPHAHMTYGEVLSLKSYCRWVLQTWCDALRTPSLSWGARGAYRDLSLFIICNTAACEYHKEAEFHANRCPYSDDSPRRVEEQLATEEKTQTDTFQHEQ